MKLKLLTPHVIEDRWYPKGAVIDAPPGYQPTAMAEPLDDEAVYAVEYARLQAWGRYPWPYGLYPTWMGVPLDNPPIPRPLEENQPVFHYTGSPEYL